MPRLIIPFFLLAVSVSAWAQDDSLVELLSKLEEETGATFSYDADLISDLEITKGIQSIDDLSSLFDSKSALRLEKVSDEEYLIAPKKSNVKFSFKGHNQDDVLTEFYVDIIRGENEVLFQDFIADPKKPIEFSWTPKPNDTIKLISTAYDPILLPGNQLLFELNQSITLTEKVTYLDEVIIQNYLAKGINLNVKDQTVSMEMNELALIPGETDGDILASLATLPGINTPDSRAGNLFIRGSSSDQNLLLYNNIPIYHRGHYFGTISPYNPAVISNVTVSKNGYDPSLGGRVGGTIEISSPNQLSEFDEFGIGVNSLYGNAFLKSKIGKKIGVSLSARRSLPSGVISPKLTEISEMVYSATALTADQNEIDLDEIDVVYEDYTLNVLFEPNSRNKLKLSSLFTNNSTEYISSMDDTNSVENHSFDNIGTSLSWDHKLNNNISGKLIAFYSEYQSEYDKRDIDNQAGEVSFDDGVDNQIVDAGASFEAGIRLSDENELSIGVASQWTDVSYKSNTSLNDTQTIIADSENAMIHSVFSKYSYDGWEKLYFQLGGRVDYYSALSKAYLSPRLKIGYDLMEDVTLKASAGRYYQFLNQIKYLQFGDAGFDNELWRLAGNDEISVLHSDQFMVGGVFTKGRFVFDLEAYQKNISNVNYATTYRLQTITEYAPAEWEILGMDFFTKVQVSNGLSLWGSYEYSEHTITFDSLESVSFNYKYNRPNRLKLGGLYHNGRWKFSFSWKIMSGLYGRSLDIISELDQISRNGSMQPMMPPNQPPDDGGPGGGGPGGGGPPGGGPPMDGDTPPERESVSLGDLPERYPNFNSLDVFVTYELPRAPKRKWRANFGVSLINVLNNRNQIDQVVRGPINRRTLLPRYAIGFAPNLNISITW